MMPYLKIKTCAPACALERGARIFPAVDTITLVDLVVPVLLLGGVAGWQLVNWRLHVALAVVQCSGNDFANATVIFPVMCNVYSP